MNAIQIQTTGGPEVLRVVDLPIPVPGPGQVLIRVEAVGVNFIEIYFRKGQYKATMPLVPGTEAAGTVEELGSGVTGFKAGDELMAAPTAPWVRAFIAGADRKISARRRWKRW